MVEHRFTRQVRALTCGLALSRKGARKGDREVAEERPEVAGSTPAPATLLIRSVRHGPADAAATLRTARSTSGPSVVVVAMAVVRVDPRRLAVEPPGGFSVAACAAPNRREPG